MYIDMDTKATLLPKGKYFIKDGKKINDHILVKYDSKKLRQKFNIWKLIEVGKRDEAYWKVSKRVLKEDPSTNTVTATLTTVPRYTLDELKAGRILDIKEILWGMFKLVVEEYDQLTHPWSPLLTNGPRIAELEAFFTELKTSGQSARDAVNLSTDYDALVDFSPDLPEVP